jgi:hypothetical protein
MLSVKQQRSSKLYNASMIPMPGGVGIFFEIDESKNDKQIMIIINKLP